MEGRPAQNRRDLVGEAARVQLQAMIDAQGEPLLQSAKIMANGRERWVCTEESISHTPRQRGREVEIQACPSYSKIVKLCST